MDAPPVQYVTTSDGYNIAYACSGEGQPFVLMPLRMSHIELAWADSKAMRPWLEGLAGRFRLVQYDSRGQGMSTRGLPEEFSLADYGADLAAVIDRLKLERFVLMAHGGFGHVAVRYTIAHPGDVKALVLFPTRVSSTPGHFIEQARLNWELFLDGRVGGAALPPEQRRVEIERLRQTATQSDFVICTAAINRSSVEQVLAQVSVPTLVIHPRDYPIYPQEESMALAARIPGAQIVLIDGSTSLGDYRQGLKAIDDFLSELEHEDRQGVRPTDAARQPSSDLSAREIEVLRLIAAGRSNQQIADELVISLNTVARHVSNIFDKTGAANRAEAAVYATRHGLA